MFSLLSIGNSSLKNQSRVSCHQYIYIFLNVTDRLPRLRLTEKRFSVILNLGTGVLCTVEFR